MFFPFRPSFSISCLVRIRAYGRNGFRRTSSWFSSGNSRSFSAIPYRKLHGYPGFPVHFPVFPAVPGPFALVRSCVFLFQSVLFFQISAVLPVPAAFVLKRQEFFPDPGDSVPSISRYLEPFLFPVLFHKSLISACLPLNFIFL